ncbi:hypothetical protein NC99_40040 [Sunxiuqinia dokdonensis]|uniref:Uncharacterized protein n=1 Tax=Sunxiuqinia dokdonensis TaxID=1409788 RepID=A0A0L8V3Y0_9BACT|nr:hypothetical protein NC99_40040 [Sunxiuqinia dokdonensis]
MFPHKLKERFIHNWKFFPLKLWKICLPSRLFLETKKQGDGIRCLVLHPPHKTDLLRVA